MKDLARERDAFIEKRKKDLDPLPAPATVAENLLPRIGHDRHYLQERDPSRVRKVLLKVVKDIKYDGTSEKVRITLELLPARMIPRRSKLGSGGRI